MPSNAKVLGMLQIVALGAAAIGVAAAYIQNSAFHTPATSDADAAPPALPLGTLPSPSTTEPVSLAKSAIRVLPRNVVAEDAGSTVPVRDMRNFLTGSRRDYTPLDANTSLNDRLRFYNRDAPKVEVAAEEFVQTTPVANVHVRNDLPGLLQAMRRNYDIATAPHRNVTPVATTTGTAYQLVGPGIGVDREALHGDSGFHYGMMRIRPPPTTDVYPTTREQRGVVSASQAMIKNYTTHIGDVLKNLPDRSFAMDDAYLTSSNGRSATISAEAPRVMPEPEWRSARGTGTSIRTASGPAVTTTGAMSANVQHMTEFVVPDSGNRGARGVQRIGSVTGGPAGAYMTGESSLILPVPQRGAADGVDGREVHFGAAMSAHGSANDAAGRRAQHTGVNSTQRGARDSVRGGELSAQVGGKDGNAGASAGALRADRGGIEASVDARPTQRDVDAARSVRGAEGERRTGIAAGPSCTRAVPGYEYERHIAHSDVREPTMRDLTSAATPWRAGAATAASSGGLAPVRTGYVNDSTKELDSAHYVPPAGGVISTYEAVGNIFEAAVPGANASRGVEGHGGVQRQATSNYYVRRAADAVDDGPVNKMPSMNTRLDPSILYALTQNEWVNPIVKKGAS